MNPKIIAGVALAGALALGGNAASIEIQVNQLPQEQRFVAPVSDVLDVESLGGSQVEYAYIDETLSQPLPDEVVDMRTPMSVTTLDPDTGVYTASYGATEFYQEADGWHDVHYATTTKQAYDLQETPLIPFTEVQAATTIFTSSGTWTAPVGVSVVDARAWGDGGGGGCGGFSTGGGGGGGGAYAENPTQAVTAGNTYTVTVGLGGNGGVAAAPCASQGISGIGSMFISSSTLLAAGGTGGGTSVGGAGATTAASIGSVLFAGGTGGTDGSSNGAGSGGGGGAGSTGAGGVGGNSSGAATVGVGGTGTALGGGNGATGTNGATGSAGSPAGGGGSGAGNVITGSKGGRGEVDIIFGGIPTHAQATFTRGQATFTGGTTIIQ